VRLRETGDRAEWAVDTWDAVAAEVAAALNITLMMAGGYVRLAKAMHERLPLLGMVFAAGDIDYRAFQTIVYRTDLITDPDTLAIVDGELASRAPRWTALSQGKFGREVDRIVAKADQDAVRRRKERVEDREVVVVDSGDGMAAVCANVFATDGHAFEQRFGCARRHSLRCRSAYQATAACGRDGRVGGWGRPAGLPMRQVRLPGRRQGGGSRRAAPRG
jgi:hypothetical protein